MKLISRPRRNRKSKAMLDAIADIEVKAQKLILPIFISNKTEKMPSIDQVKFSLKGLEDFCKTKLKKSKIMGVLIFASVDEKLKNPQASEALNPEGLLPQAVKIVRKFCPNLEVFTDVALDPFSSDGHDGLVKKGKILNDESVEVLCQMALVHAQAGATWIAPSDMMDGRVAAIRETLDKNGFTDVGILSYTAKYASHFYGPFREILKSAPKKGDKSTYQMDYRNSHESLRELYEDLNEGADMVMVKPALSYLDIIQKIKSESLVPVVAYSVSGEYAMVKAAAKAGLIDGVKVQNEILTSIHRAGADIIITYGALDV